jgi:hypothetical protein
MIKEGVKNSDLILQYKPKYKVTIALKNSVVFTEDDYLINVTGINQELNNETNYAIGNVTITLKNKD